MASLKLWHLSRQRAFSPGQCFSTFFHFFHPMSLFGHFRPNCTPSPMKFQLCIVCISVLYIQREYDSFPPLSRTNVFPLGSAVVSVENACFRASTLGMKQGESRRQRGGQIHSGLSLQVWFMDQQHHHCPA